MKISRLGTPRSKVSMPRNIPEMNVEKTIITPKSNPIIISIHGFTKTKTAKVNSASITAKMKNGSSLNIFEPRESPMTIKMMPRKTRPIRATGSERNILIIL